MNCARAGVENQNGCKIRTTSGTHNHHVLPPSPSHHPKKNENKVMEKGKKSKKHEPLGMSSKKLVWRRLKSLKNRHEEKSKDWRFPLKNNPRSSLTVDPTRNSQTIVLDNYGSFHIFQRFALVADSPL
ncbi:hypothetical protein F2Q70_00030615 [Brassica cretica]|uniref:Uncharacterized protein n=1 Tax=Brassica cretica TaxID=69181 RepID=A0A8S9FC12_BRACR|nr:hypothetical protein F2Q70_00030615 [Brassica cretica]